MYTAKSVRNAIEKIIAGRGYHFERVEFLKCPTAGYIHDGRTQKECCGDFTNCYEAHSKTCKQSVFIRRNADRWFKRTLNFYFTVSDDCSEGFIDEKDSVLIWIINELKLIDKKDLICV